MKISARDKYTVFINERFVGHGHCIQDVPLHKTVATYDITDYLCAGENTIRIESVYVYVEPEAFSMPSAIAFEIFFEGKLIASSNQKTLCRQTERIKAGDVINDMLGYALNYDFCSPEREWEESTVVETNCIEECKRIPLVEFAGLLDSEIVAQGIFKFRGGKTVAQKMQAAWLCTKRFQEMTGEQRITYASLGQPIRFAADDGEGIFVIADLGMEAVGALSFSVFVDTPCRAYVGWGEHLADLRVRTEINGFGHERNFAQEFLLRKGENKFDGYLERIGCRYLCMFVETNFLTVSRLTLREEKYPFKKPRRDFGDRLLNKIYEVGRRTLELCAHEYYEDCPWREQGLYADGSYQMLFGYCAFEEYEFPRESLRLMAYASGKDGFVRLRTPIDSGFVIPAHSAHWLWSFIVNTKMDFNKEFVDEMLPYAEKIMDTFRARTNDKGVTVFVEPTYWNWHDWSVGLEGGDFNRTEYIAEDVDGVLTAIVCRLSKGLSEVERKVGREKKAEALAGYSNELSLKLENFYNAEKGLYASYIRGNSLEGYHAYMQSLVILAKNLPEGKEKYLSQCLKYPQERLVDMGIGTLVWKYEAIIKSEKDVDWCIEDICNIFGKMIFSGATSYWETPYGEADFLDAGSLCHAWSAVACYIFDKYLPQSDQDMGKKLCIV